jgi:hypothetical protein
MISQMRRAVDYVTGNAIEIFNVENIIFFGPLSAQPLSSPNKYHDEGSSAFAYTARNEAAYFSKSKSLAI